MTFADKLSRPLTMVPRLIKDRSERLTTVLDWARLLVSMLSYRRMLCKQSRSPRTAAIWSSPWLRRQWRVFDYAKMMMVVAPSLSMIKTLGGPMSFSKDAVPAARATGGRRSCTWLHRGWGYVLSYVQYAPHPYWQRLRSSRGCMAPGGMRSHCCQVSVTSDCYSRHQRRGLVIRDIVLSGAAHL